MLDSLVLKINRSNISSILLGVISSVLLVAILNRFDVKYDLLTPKKIDDIEIVKNKTVLSKDKLSIHIKNNNKYYHLKDNIYGNINIPPISDTTINDITYYKYQF